MTSAFISCCFCFRTICVVFVLFLHFDCPAAKEEIWYTGCDDGQCGYGGQGTEDCHDLHENAAECREFALKGECKKNPNWMHQYCRKSCGLCVAIPTEPCTDLHSSCPQWSNELECDTNPGYMARACRRSCWLCSDPDELRKQNANEKFIERVTKFSQTDFGLWQSIPEHDDGRVRVAIQQMGVYMRQLENIGPGTLCNNLHHECAEWSVTRGCEQHFEFMLSECSLACKYCDKVEEYHSCSNREGLSRDPFGNINKILTNLFHQVEGDNLVVDHLKQTSKPGEWVISVSKKKLWKDNIQEFEMANTKIIDLLKSEKPVIGLEWKDSSPSQEVSSKDAIKDLYDVPNRSGKTALCGKDCRHANPIMNDLFQRIASLLEVDPIFLQSLEFVHYARGERYAMHHDFTLDGAWKHAGNHVMTVFLVLQSPKAGGSFGFPELDWMVIEEPEMLIWPNVGKDMTLPLERLQSEQLPVSEGDLYGVYTWVRQFPYDEENPCA